MKPHKQSLAIITWIAALVVASLACSTFFGGAPATALPEDRAAVATVDISEGQESQAAESTESPTETVPIPTESPTKSSAERSPSADLNQTFEPFWESWDILHEYFVDQPLDDGVMLQGAIDGLVEHADIDPQPVDESIALEFSAAAETPADLRDQFVDFWKVWAASSGESEVFLMRAALRGMIAALGDRHTAYLDPDQLRVSNAELEGSYEGIGAYVDPDNEYLTIISPIPGSPAEEVGLKPGDQIIAVDGEDMTGIDGNLVIRRVIGPAGTEVVLTIQREGLEPFDVTVVRAEIQLPSIEGEILEDTNLAYIHLFTFGATTGEDLHLLLDELLSQEPDGLILDLRGNGGGFLDTAIQVASEFIGDGVVMYEIFGDGSRETYESLGDGLATDIPLVVLVDQGSASASEIVAGAIQDYGRAPLVGMTTFGKGSVQIALPLSDEGAIRVTIAAWYTPEERRIHEIGLAPDFFVEFSDADLDAGTDPQLDRAIEILTGES